MHSRISLSSIPLPVIPVVTFVLAGGAQLLFWAWTWTPGRGAIPLALVIAGLVVSAVAGWMSWLLASVCREQQGLRNRLVQSEDQMRSIKSLMGGSLRMDTGLLNAVDEEQVMDVALSVIAEMTGAKGASFVPLDEWGQALPAHTYGKLPPLLLKAWTERANSSQTRQTCRNCQQHMALPGDFCPLVDGPFSHAMGVYCFPMQRGERLLGMVNLFMPGRPELDDELTGYLRGFLTEAALAVEGIRLRARETHTLQQLHVLRAPRTDLQVLLSALMEGLQQALEVDGVQLEARGPQGSNQSDLRIEQGQAGLFQLAEAYQVRQQVISTGRACLPGTTDRACSDPRFTAVPLSAPDGQVIGSILLASASPKFMDERQATILQSVADQAALLVENERDVLSLEYRAVIQERARLAREIHDGLAQTLAFLKLQAAQMQTYLTQGNTAKLEQVLKQNYEDLADAYLETRQAIDNLRVTPQQGLSIWLEQLAVDFERASGLKVERSFNDGHLDLSPEVQAQMVRIVQEALNNVRKHAHAGRVVITLREWNEDLVLEVHDDGQGFSPEDIPGLSQYGLRGMRERAELIGADFQVISKPRQGTTIRLSLPAHRQEKIL